MIKTDYIYTRRADSSEPDFTQLQEALVSDLKVRDGVDHEHYAEINLVDGLHFVVIGYHDSFPVACGGLRPYTNHELEIKRMYVKPLFRRKNFATIILLELENWAKELGFPSCILETGKNQPEAIALYQKNNYSSISPFGRYIGSKNSVCFRKIF
ncbi:MAG TPA: GNAT family N-acetyltransferase [Puia sp.]|nr:GNAT family N-acetyltransferase [Puia sp.]